MKRLSVLLVLSVLGVLVAAPSVQAATPSPFVGAWTGNDPVNPGDGSTLYLSISGGTTVRLTFIDTFGTICGNHGSPTDMFSSSLTGTVSGDTLDATFVWARCGPVVFDFLVDAPMTFTYDSVTDTLSDGSVTWHRQ